MHHGAGGLDKQAGTIMLKSVPADRDAHGPGLQCILDCLKHLFIAQLAAPGYQDGRGTTLDHLGERFRVAGI